MKDLGHWVLSDEVSISEVPFGFVYEIINKKINKRYIGKKQCKAVRKRPPLKGRVNKRCTLIETDWRTYTGSCTELNEHIKMYGKENFEFKILKPCNSKSELAYWEGKIQFERDVLIKEEYYNGIINLRVSKIKG